MSFHVESVILLWNRHGEEFSFFMKIRLIHMEQWGKRCMFDLASSRKFCFIFLFTIAHTAQFVSEQSSQKEILLQKRAFLFLFLQLKRIVINFFSTWKNTGFRFKQSFLKLQLRDVYKLKTDRCERIFHGELSIFLSILLERDVITNFAI